MNELFVFFLIINIMNTYHGTKFDVDWLFSWGDMKETVLRFSLSIVSYKKGRWSRRQAKYIFSELTRSHLFFVVRLPR